MIGEIRLTVRLLCVLTPLLLLAELLIPRGSMRTYARFLFALLEMTVLLRPLLSLFGRIEALV